ncbi:hypothetical protein Celaphus_00008018, partial [Cervus elaphus hippelaphus]
MMSVLKRFLVSLVPQLSVRLLTDKNGKSKDFAYVSFENCEDAQKTIEGMNGKVLNGSHQTNEGVMAVNGKLEIIKPLYVTIAQSKKGHQALLKKYVKRVGALKDR